MTKYLRIDNDDDYYWLKSLVERWLGYDPNNPRLQANIEAILNWKRYLDNVVPIRDIPKPDDGEPAAVALQPSAVEKKKKAGRPAKATTVAAQKAKELKAKQAEKFQKQKEKANNPFGCIDHPTYGGVRRPRTDCAKCWDIYKKLHPSEYKRAVQDFERSKRRQSTAS